MDLIENDSLKDFDKLKSSAEFCLECGDLLNLPIYSDMLDCPKCGFKISLLDYPMEEIVTHKEYTEKKVWLEKYYDKTNKGMKPEDASKVARPTIDMECPVCSNKKMYYTSRQMRSADEGETVIYECTKCAHTFSHNS